MSDILQEPIKIFRGLPKNRARVNALLATFEKKYGGKPEFIARAPGRVSLIGEHIDYAGLSVMPAAIDRDIMVACSASLSQTGQTVIDVANVNPKFASERVSYRPGKEGPALDANAHSWVNYFIAGLKGVLQHLPEDQTGRTLHLHILVDGNIPPAGGLSSSAAMVVSSAIAMLRTYDAISQVTQGQLARIAIESETLVGVNSGGMDQSASIFSRKDNLLNVHFVPQLGADLVPFPKGKPGISFVVANTLVISEKQVTAKYHYNLRVVEMRVAAKLLQKYLKLSMPLDLPTIKHVMDAYLGESEISVRELQNRLKRMEDVVEEVFGCNTEADAWEDVYKKLGVINGSQFQQRFHPDFDIEADKLKLYKRAKHAYSEARRVYAYRELLEADQGGLAERLGDLMNASQASCRDLFECSCREIDDICEMARKAGSLGSRLSGAGWGGCTVHLVPAELEEHLVQRLQKDYYAERFPHIGGEELDAALFATRPEEGACLYELRN